MPKLKGEQFIKEQRLVSQSLMRFLLFSMVVLAFFSILNYSQGLPLLALVQAAVLLTLPFAYSWLKKGAPHSAIKHLIGFDAMVIFVPLIFVPTIDNTGIYWVFGYPMIVLFFLGVRTGFQWTLIYFLTLIAGIALAHQGVLTLRYSNMQVALAFVEVIVFAAIGYFFISDRERAEKQQALHLHYLESVDRIERALHADLDLEKSMEDALECLLDIFDSSRTWMVFPAHPGAASYQVQFEKHRQEFPPLIPSGREIPSTTLSRQTFLDGLKSDKPVCYSKSHLLSEDSETSRLYSIRSQMAITLNRDSETPWMLGMHQCDRDRTWSNEEQRLFQDIAKRMEDALNQMLLYQELTTSEKNLRIAIKEAEAANHAKSEFLSVMSHELRTPLHGIIGLQNLIASDSHNLSEEQRENLILAQQSAKSLRSLVNDVLDLAKIESGNMELIKEPFNLSDCINDALVPFILAAREKGLSLKLEMSNMPASMVGDESRLRQVLLNLVGNAVKFTEQGYILVKVIGMETHISFSVEDSGVGIPPESVATIFEPFIQVTSAKQPQQSGTGLGTSIVKHFVELMGGTIDVESTPGQGSRFTFQIPCKATDSDTITQSIDVLTGNLNKISTEIASSAGTTTKPKSFIRALLAEDDPIGQRIAMKQLSRAGIMVDAVDNGTSAWETLQESNYSLLLTDIRMPGLDGIELTRKVRAMEKETGKEPITIIGLSAHALEEVAKECRAAGMDDFMTKPVNPEMILSTVLATHPKEK